MKYEGGTSSLELDTIEMKRWEQNITKTWSVILFQSLNLKAMPLFLKILSINDDFDVLAIKNQLKYVGNPCILNLKEWFSPARIFQREEPI